MLAKNSALIARYYINKLYENEAGAHMRPSGFSNNLSKVDKEAYFNIKSYLVDPSEEIIDEDGNTTIHLVAKNDNLAEFQTQLKNNPQFLFMLNKDGYTCLDMAIREKDMAKAAFLIEKAVTFGP